MIGFLEVRNLLLGRLSVRVQFSLQTEAGRGVTTGDKRTQSRKSSQSSRTCKLWIWSSFAATRLCKWTKAALSGLSAEAFKLSLARERLSGE